MSERERHVHRIGTEGWDDRPEGDCPDCVAREALVAELQGELPGKLAGERALNEEKCRAFYERATKAEQEGERLRARETRAAAYLLVYRQAHDILVAAVGCDDVAFVDALNGLVQERDAMRPVVTAALAWREGKDAYVFYGDNASLSLRAALDAYTRALEGGERPLDACQVCHGKRGDEPGNENIVGGVVMCDDCHADDMDRRAREGGE